MDVIQHTEKEIDKMKEEKFEYGEPVEVSNSDFLLRCIRYYVGSAPGSDKPYLTISEKQRLEDLKEGKSTKVDPYKQIRKIKKPESVVLVDTEKLENIENRIQELERFERIAISRMQAFDKLIYNLQRDLEKLSFANPK